MAENSAEERRKRARVCEARSEKSAREREKAEKESKRAANEKKIERLKTARDSIQSQTENRANLLNSINLILPYVMPGFIYGASNDAIYDLSMTCLENSRDILRVLEEEYQSIYERNLTLNRLGEVVLSPCCPDRGDHLNYDYHLAPSVYVENDIVRLIRLKELIK